MTLFTRVATTLQMAPAVTMHANTSAIQKGPIFQCFICGAQATGLHTWAELPHSAGYAPLDAWGEHIAYLTLPTCPQDHPRRIAKLGDCITVLDFPEEYAGRGCFAERQQQNIQAVQAALARIAAAIPEDTRVNDAATNLVYSIIGGLVTPEDAVAHLRRMLSVTAHTCNEEA